MIWTYMGPPELKPPPPDYELVRAPATHRFVSKTWEEANWLQALEGGLDTSHSSFAHNLDIKNKAYVRNADTAPRLEVERTPYGYTYAGIRQVDGKQYVRAYHYVMPAQQMRGRVSGRKGGIEKVPTINGHIWVPIDDENCWVYNWQYAYDPKIPVTREYAEEHETMYGRGPGDMFPGTFRLKKNLRNDYDDRPAAAEDADVHRDRGDQHAGHGAPGGDGPDRRPLERASGDERSRDHRDAPAAHWKRWMPSRAGRRSADSIRPTIATSAPSIS